MSKVLKKYTPKQKILTALSKGWDIDAINGVVRNKKGDRIGHSHPSGYEHLSIRIKGNPAYVLTHRLIGYLKYGDVVFVEGVAIRHLDGDSANNRWDNLLIGSYSQNSLDIPKEKRIDIATYASSFVKKHDHELIVKDHINGMPYSAIMKKYNISSKGTVSFIINNSIASQRS